MITNTMRLAKMGKARKIKGRDLKPYYKLRDEVIEASEQDTGTTLPTLAEQHEQLKELKHTWNAVLSGEGLGNNRVLKKQY